MKVLIDSEDIPVIQKMNQNLNEPALYIFPVFQTDCFGEHQTYHFEILERKDIESRNSVINNPENDLSFHIFQDSHPIFEYPEIIELGITWEPTGKEIYIRKITR